MAIHIASGMKYPEMLLSIKKFTADNFNWAMKKFTADNAIGSKVKNFQTRI